VIFGGERGEVGADFGEHDLRDPGTNPIDPCEVHTGEAPEGGAGLQLAAPADGFLLGRVRMRGDRFVVPRGRLERFEFLEKVRVVRCDLFLERIVESQSAGQVE